MLICFLKTEYFTVHSRSQYIYKMIKIQLLNNENSQKMIHEFEFLI